MVCGKITPHSGPEPVMTQQQTSLAHYWSNFVTADGWGYTFGRLTLSLGISILFFPFGPVLILLLWASGMSWTADVLMEGSSRNASAKLGYRLLAASFILPSIIGACSQLLDIDRAAAAGQFLLYITGFSIFPTSLADWVSYYADDPLRGTKYVLTVVSAICCFGLLTAEYMRALRRLIVQQAAELLSSGAKLPSYWHIAILSILCLATPYYFCLADVHRLKFSGPSTRMGSPDLLLLAFSIPNTLFVVGLMPFGAYAALRQLAVTKFKQRQ
jgi:hypothetical protein